jgi:hypothetical protein
MRIALYKICQKRVTASIKCAILAKSSLDSLHLM